MIFVVYGNPMRNYFSEELLIVTCGDMKEELEVGAAISEVKYSTWTLGVDVHCDIIPADARRNIIRHYNQSG